MSSVLAIGALAWLLRWPMLGSRVEREARRRLSELLDARVDIGRLGGSLVSGLQAEHITIHAAWGDATIEQADIDYGVFGTSDPDIVLTGIRLSVTKRAEGPARPPQETAAELVEALRDFRFPGRLRVRDAVAVLPDGQEIAIDEGSVQGGVWHVRARRPLLDVQARFEEPGVWTLAVRENGFKISAVVRGMAVEAEGEVAGRRFGWTGEIGDTEVAGRLALPEGAVESTLRVEDGTIVLGAEGQVDGITVALHASGPWAGPWIIDEAWVGDTMIRGTLARDREGLGLDLRVAGVELRGKLSVAGDEFAYRGTVADALVDLSVALSTGQASLKGIVRRETFVSEVDARARWSDDEVSARLVAHPTIEGRSMAPFELDADVARATGRTEFQAEWGEHLRASGSLGEKREIVARLNLTSLPLFVDGVVDLRLAGDQGTVAAQGLALEGDPAVDLLLPFRVESDGLLLERSTHATPYGEVTLEGRVGRTTHLVVHMEDVDVRARIPEGVRPWIPPRVRATAVVEDGAVHIDAASVDGEFRLPEPMGPVSDFRVVATLARNTLRFERIEGRLGGGPWNADGEWHLDKPAIRLRLEGTDMLIVDRFDGRVRINPYAELTWTPDAGVSIVGDVAVPLALYYGEFGGAGSGGQEIAAPGLRLPLASQGGITIPGIPGLEDVTIDLKVAGTGEVRIENSTVGTLLSVAGRLRGTGDEPAATGTITATQGEVRLTTAVFVQILDGRLEIYEEPGRDPFVHFEGRAGRGDDSISVTVSGALQEPGLTLASDPPRSQQDLLAMLAFGRPAGGLGQQEALGTLAAKLYQTAMDDWPRAEPREGLLSRLQVTAAAPDAQARAMPWELPPSGTTSGTAIRTEYFLSPHFSIVAQGDFQGRWIGDLKLRWRFR
ncbi:MAG: translocation/assembly module TamB domain-containing protein [Planctomycetes bacterium]|nr:translocation/assembly module TamB domain-containing protein [Planctomycetota bacterium]